MLEAMLPYFGQMYGNASSLHTLGREAHEAMETSREKLGTALGADMNDMIFTSGAPSRTISLFKASPLRTGTGESTLSPSAIEHHAILYTCRFLESQGFKVTYLPVDPKGLVSTEDLRAAMTKETILVSIMAANNEMGR